MWTAVAEMMDPKPITSPYFFTLFPYALARSFVGIFGWMRISMPEWIYQLFGLLALLAIVGSIYRVIRRRIDTRLMVILLTAPLLSLLITIHINLTFTQPQGRYLFPALSAIALLVAIGLEGLPVWSWRLTIIVLGILVLVNFYVVYAVILPTYWTPPSG